MSEIRVHLDIKGVGITVTTFDPELAKNLRHDFHYFISSAPTKPSLQVSHRPKNLRPSTWRELFSVGDTVLYRPKKKEQRTRFFGDVWVSYRFEDRKCTIFSDAGDKAYEACYLVVLSYAGECLDLRGIHRVHGMGLSIDNSGVLFLAPSGGGKSTLALRCLKRADVRFLSDDTPLIDGQGHMHAFPQRIGLREMPEGKAGDHTRKFSRVHFGEKFVVGSEGFESQVTASSKLRAIALIEKKGGILTQVSALDRRQLVWRLMKWLVAGYETPQIWQLYLRLSAKDIFRKAGIFASRLRVAAQLLKTKNLYRVELSSDPDESAQALTRLMRSLREVSA